MRTTKSNLSVQRHIFGANLLQHALISHYNDAQQIMPELERASHIACHNFYMDDLLVSLSKQEEAFFKSRTDGTLRKEVSN